MLYIHYFKTVLSLFKFSCKLSETVLHLLTWSSFGPTLHSSPLQWCVPQTPAGPVRPTGSALHRPDGVVHCSVHPPRLRAGDLAVCQVRVRPFVSCHHE